MGFKKLASNSAIFIAGMMVGNIANWLFNLIMGRMLGPANYGVIVALTSLLLIITVPATSIQTVAMKFTTTFGSANNFPAINFLWRYLTKKVFWLGLAIFLITVAASKPIANFLQIPSYLPVIILSLVFLLIFLTPISRGILQGLQRFLPLSINLSIEALIKLGVAILLVYLGFQVKGAILAFPISVFLAYLLCFIPLRKIIFGPKQKFIINGLGQYFGSVLLALILLAIIFNTDIILVKHFFPAEQAGLYSALAVVGRIIYWLTAPIAGVMFPMIADLQTKGKPHYHVLANSLGLVGAISLILLAAYFIAPGLIIRTLFGNQYIEVYQFLGYFGFAMVLYSLIFVFVNYFLSIKKIAFLAPLALGAIIEFLLIWFFHDTFLTVIKMLIISTAIIFSSLVLMYLWEKRARIYEAISHRTGI